jgi:tRNA-splicing endonuclease subunit Sen2
LERKQFKIDRAAAMLDAAKAAEAVITTGQAPAHVLATSTGGAKDGEVEDQEADEQGDEEQEGQGGEEQGDEAETESIATTTTATAPNIDISTLTPQTFLVRPTRPDSNRNRGRNAFKRKPKPKPTTPADPSAAAAAASPQTPTTAPQAPTPAPPTAAVDPETGISKAELEEEEEDWFDESLIDEAEHLQLGLEEAWFLSTALGVLRIHDPETVCPHLTGGSSARAFLH